MKILNIIVSFIFIIILVNKFNCEKIIYNKNIINKNVKALESSYIYKIVPISYEYVNVSYYGSDCIGCSGITKSGYNVNNTIYYNDLEYGKVRVVAADNKYPFGSIIKVDDVIAIVLDRGSKINDHSKFQIDMLTYSEKDSYKEGIKEHVKLELLRQGY